MNKSITTSIGLLGLLLLAWGTFSWRASHSGSSTLPASADGSSHSGTGTPASRQTPVRLEQHGRAKGVLEIISWPRQEPVAPTVYACATDGTFKLIKQLQNPFLETETAKDIWKKDQIVVLVSSHHAPYVFTSMEQLVESRIRLLESAWVKLRCGGHDEVSLSIRPRLKLPDGLVKALKAMVPKGSFGVATTVQRDSWQRIELLPGTRYDIKVTGEMIVDIDYHLMPLEAGEVRRVDLSSRLATGLKGQVLRHDGRPASGAVTSLFSNETQGSMVQSRQVAGATCDTNGMFVLKGLEEGPLKLLVEYAVDGTASIMSREVLVKKDELTDLGTLVLDSIPLAAGSVTLENGNPVGGVYVQLTLPQPNEPLVLCKTSRDGRFEFRGSAPGGDVLKLSVVALDAFKRWPGKRAVYPTKEVVPGTNNTTLTLKFETNLDGIDSILILFPGERRGETVDLSLFTGNSELVLRRSLQGDHENVISTPHLGSWKQPLIAECVFEDGSMARVSSEVSGIEPQLVLDFRKVEFVSSVSLSGHIATVDRPLSGKKLAVFLRPASGRRVSTPYYRWTWTAKDGSFTLSNVPPNQRFLLWVSCDRRRLIPVRKSDRWCEVEVLSNAVNSDVGILEFQFKKPGR